MDLNIKLPKKVKEIAGKFLDVGAEIYVVGGASRDLLLGREVADWDFTTNLTPEEMKVLFPKNSFCENKFGTFSIVRGGEVFEVTTFRTERGYSDARHPDEVKWGSSLTEDLQRRDFTVNAIAIDLKKSGDGIEVKEIIDKYGGLKDLNKGIIKSVGRADDRFGEDALRMMRAIRIASQIGFKIEKNTFESIKNNAALINKVAGERIRDELFKLLLSPLPGKGVEMLRDSGLLAHIMPELMTGLNLAQKGHHIYDVWQHGIETLNNCVSNNPVTRLACLLHDVGKPATAVGSGEERTFHNHEVVGSRIAVAIGKKLRLSNKQLDMLFRLVRWHMFTTEKKQTDKAVKRFIRRVTPEYIDEMITLRRADRIGSGAAETSWRWELFKKRIVEVQKQPFTIKDLKVSGNDVMEVMGIRPGPKVGDVLEELFREVEDNPELNQRDILMEKLQNMK
jgi:tRNA nucleotidyltransferase (CCA-adding enzyme)